jgi:hypothetical protein
MKDKICGCGADISDTWQDNDGFTPAGWFCSSCNLFIADEDDDQAVDPDEDE